MIKALFVTFAIIMFAAFIRFINKKIAVLNQVFPEKIRSNNLVDFNANMDFRRLKMGEKLWLFSPIYYKLKTLGAIPPGVESSLSKASILLIVTMFGFMFIPVLILAMIG